MTTVVRGRWDGDEYGRGIGDGLALAAGPRRLLAAMAADGWLAEEPEAHLLPHLEYGGRPWELVEAAVVAGGIYAVTMRRPGPAPRLGRVRVEAYAVIGRLAETSTSVVERVVDERCVEYDVVTGSGATDSEFAPHGHLLRLRVVWD